MKAALIASICAVVAGAVAGEPIDKIHLEHPMGSEISVEVDDLYYNMLPAFLAGRVAKLVAEGDPEQRLDFTWAAFHYYTGYQVAACQKETGNPVLLPTDFANQWTKLGMSDATGEQYTYNKDRHPNPLGRMRFQEAEISGTVVLGEDGLVTFKPSAGAVMERWLVFLTRENELALRTEMERRKSVVGPAVLKGKIGLTSKFDVPSSKTIFSRLALGILNISPNEPNQDSPPPSPSK